MKIHDQLRGPLAHWAFPGTLLCMFYYVNLIGVGHFNRLKLILNGPEIGYFYSQNYLEVTF